MEPAARVTRSFADLASMSYPKDMSISMSFMKSKSVTIPDLLIKSIVAIGFLSAAYHVKDLVKGIWHVTASVCHRIAGIFRSRPRTGTAVIYGAANKNGRAFALRFAADGHDLILIDSSQARLERLKESLIKVNENLEDHITCCVLSQATTLKEMKNDGSLKEIYAVLKQQKEIAYFVNCRNVKKKEIKMFHELKSTQVILMTYFNMTVYAALLRKTLKIMQENGENHGCVICINSTYKQEHILKKTHPLFFACSQFASTLLETLKLTYKEFGIQFLNVHNNYRNLASGNKYSELVDTTLQNIGLYEDIYV